MELKVVPNPDGEGWVLEGRMRVGDCVDDEWCAVWLLREISAKWDVVISVFDSDGEFLLIEAAESLPSWVTPSNAENRVWIYHSRLHLIPLSHVSAPSSKPRRRRYPGGKDSDDEEDITGNQDEDNYISAQDALELVRDPLADTFAPAEVEKTVWARITGYPAAARQHVHVTKKPVETFYTRDAIQLRAAHRMSRFPPEPSILTTVKVTRTAYAQLVGQKFYPPKIFGRWQEKESTTEWRWRDVGMKIACGFEMLYQESKSRSDVSPISADAVKSSAQARKDALRRNLDYMKYVENLRSSGYFKGELEGSQLWTELEDKAAAAFLEARREDDATRPSFASAMTAAVSQVGDNFVPPQQNEDSNDWLNVDAADFDAMLEKNFGAKPNIDSTESPDAMDVDSGEKEKESPEDRMAKQQAQRLKDLAQKVEKFVEGEGDIEGARFADEEFSDEEFSDDDQSDSDMTQSEADAEPRPQPPRNDVEQAARQAAMDKLVPGLDPAEYGKMPPSFHNNSQRVAPITMETELREVFTAVSPGTSGEPQKRPIRPPIIPRDKYDGVDSDDESDEENEGGGDDDEEADKPQIVGDVEIDMDEEEDEFLEFARQVLGMSDDQWSDIVRERKGRGAYVPTHIVSENKNARPAARSSQLNISESRPPQAPTQSSHTSVNPSLDSFEAVMQAMDAELARSRGDKQQYATPKVNKGKGKASPQDDIADIDIEAAMDVELKAALEKEHDGDEDGAEYGDGTDYNVIKNFLESFKSQAGLSGPVGNLAARLQPGWTLPRDQ